MFLTLFFSVLSFEIIDFDIFDSVMLGAIQLTLILGANSAAKLSVKPSIAPLAEETMLWFGNPC